MILDDFHVSDRKQNMTLVDFAIVVGKIMIIVDVRVRDRKIKIPVDFRVSGRTNHDSCGFSR